MYAPFLYTVLDYSRWYNLLRRGLELRFLCVALCRALFIFLEEQNMFDHIGDKVKTMATVFCIIGIVASIIVGAAFILRGAFIIGIIIAAVGAFISWLSCLALYAIGETAENTNRIIHKINTIENMVNKALNNSQPEAQKTTPSHTQTTTAQIKPNSKDLTEGSWWCSCGASNRNSSNTCSSCYKPRPTQK